MSKKAEKEKIAGFGSDTSSGGQSSSGGDGGSNKHTPLYAYERLHRQTNDYDGGACLTHCEGQYVAGNSCSFRWQAVYRAQHEDLDIYKDDFRLGRARLSRGHARELMAQGAAVPASRQGPAGDSDATDVIGLPFKTAFSPWPNNAHHLLPVGVILNAIEATTTSKPRLAVRIIQDLLSNKYNINHHINMMILPQQAKVSHRLGLPTHPSLKANPSVGPAVAFHKDYSAKVQDKVALILKPYDNWLEGICEPPSEGKDIVKKLNDFSQHLHDAIVANRDKFRQENKDNMNDAGDGKAGSVAKMSINSNLFCDLVAAVVV